MLDMNHIAAQMFGQRTLRHHAAAVLDKENNSSYSDFVRSSVRPPAVTHFPKRSITTVPLRNVLVAVKFLRRNKAKMLTLSSGRWNCFAM